MAGAVVRDRAERTDARRRPSRLTISQILAFGFTLALVALAAIGWTSYVRIGTLLRERVWVDHTYDVLYRIEEVRVTFRGAENGVRGFVITGRVSYLLPYQDALNNVTGELGGLTKLTADNPRQQKMLAALNTSVTAKVALLVETVDLRREADGFAAARQELLTHQGSDPMATIEADLDRMRQEEFRLLKLRRTASRDSAEETRGLILWGSITATLVVATGACWLSARIAALTRYRDAAPSPGAPERPA